MSLCPRPGRRAALLVLVGALAAAGRPAAPADHPAPAYPPTDPYETRRIEGWTVLVSGDLLRAEPELAGQALALLRHQLYQVVRKVPAAAVDKLRTVRIWVEGREP